MGGEKRGGIGVEVDRRNAPRATQASAWEAPVEANLPMPSTGGPLGLLEEGQHRLEEQLRGLVRHEMAAHGLDVSCAWDLTCDRLDLVRWAYRVVRTADY